MGLTPGSTELRMDVRCFTVTKFYLAGLFEMPGGRQGYRKADLIQMWTDPGGMRTVEPRHIVSAR